MYFKVKVLIWHYYKVHFFKSALKSRKYTILSALKWPFISLLLLYLL